MLISLKETYTAQTKWLIFMMRNRRTTSITLTLLISCCTSVIFGSTRQPYDKRSALIFGSQVIIDEFWKWTEETEEQEKINDRYYALIAPLLREINLSCAVYTLVNFMQKVKASPPHKQFYGDVQYKSLSLNYGKC